ncbi:MAG TPA: hypothetical protein IAA29_03400 [Candidatus Paenibacillus intestinavium]|nr:hypothetical protein [Candidatus Paenibacillus intestinavium]
MTAETKIFGEVDNKIRVVGIFNRFFIIENNLHPKSDDNNNIEVPLKGHVSSREKLPLG